MGEADNETTGQQPLRVGLIAAAESLASLADAATACPMQVVAQAGTRQPESLPGVEWYDDTRVMIAQSGVEAVLLSTSVRAGVQLGKTAVEHGVHVWRPPPLARSFAEAAEVVRLAQGSAPVYLVGPHRGGRGLGHGPLRRLQAPLLRNTRQRPWPVDAVMAGQHG